MGGFVFDYVQLLYEKYYKIKANCGFSYIAFPDRIENEKASINPINQKDIISISVTVVLNYEQIGKHAERKQKLNLL